MSGLAMPCLTEPQWAELAAGTMPVEQRRAATAHFDECRECCELAAALVDDDGGDFDPRLQSTRYELRRELSRGGMGRILVAFDRQLQREVAIKCLRDPAVHMDRFQREISALSKLSHPAIISILDAGHFADDFPFFVMPMLHGAPLDQHLQKTTTIEARLALTQQLLVVVDAVAYAHEVGFLHRDLKPHNVFIGKFGEVTLLDWGLAKPRRTAAGERASLQDMRIPYRPSQVNLTGIGNMVGTPAYASPEQREGNVVDERTDVYGLGAILYHVLTGKPPGTGRVVPLGEIDRRIPKDLGAIVMRALSEESDDRYREVHELSRDLSRYFAGLLVSAREYSRWERLKRLVRRRRVALLSASAIAATIAVATGAAIRITRGERDDAVVARNIALAEKRANQDTVRFVLTDVYQQYRTLGRLDLSRDLVSGVRGLRAQQSQGKELTDNLESCELALIDGEIASTEYNFAEALAKFQYAENVAQVFVVQAQSREDYLAAAAVQCRSLIAQTRALIRLDRRAEASTRLDRARSIIAQTLPNDQALRLSATFAAIDLNPSGSQKSLDALEDALAAMPGRGRDIAAIPVGERKRVTQLRTAIIDYYANVGDTPHALSESTSFLELVRAWLARAPGDGQAKLELVNALHHTAQHQFASSATNRASALELLREADVLLESLRKTDPANLDILEQAGLVANVFVIVTEDPAEKLRQADRALSTARELATLLPHDAHRREVLVVNLNNLAALEFASNLESAWRRCEEVLRVLAIGTEHFRSPVTLPAMVFGTCGTIQHMRKQPALGTALHVRAVEVTRPAALDPQGSLDARMAYVVAVLSWVDSMSTDDARDHLDEVKRAVALFEAKQPKSGRPLLLLQYGQKVVATLSAPPPTK